MLEKLAETVKTVANHTFTENGSLCHKSTFNRCLDLFSQIGAWRNEPEHTILECFSKAFLEDPTMALQILFFARDIRNGLGERRVFRIIAQYLAKRECESLAKNIHYIPEYGRWDDLINLIDHDALAPQVTEIIKQQLDEDLAQCKDNKPVSLMAKWLPSNGASSKTAAVRAKNVARRLGLTNAEYRKTLSLLRKQEDILEHHITHGDFEFDYGKQPSKAMLMYRKYFIRKDGERYKSFLDLVRNGQATLHTGTLTPFDIIKPGVLKSLTENTKMDMDETAALDATWNALPSIDCAENAIAVVDVSGSMTCNDSAPLRAAVSLGLYFAEHSSGGFHNKFITFSESPSLVEITGRNIVEKIHHILSSDWENSTNIEAVFDLILTAALRENMDQSELPDTIYIISDMEFDCCSENSQTVFEHAKEAFQQHGYRLPNLVFWNVAARHCHQPVTMNEQGVALVSGYSPNLFKMAMSNNLDPCHFMVKCLEPYQKIQA